MSDQRVFIGGPLDGQTLVVNTHVVMAQGEDLRTVTYQPMQFRGTAKEWFMMVIDGMSGDDAMQRLLDHYNPKEPS